MALIRFHDVLRVRLEEMIASRSEHLSNGLAQTMEDYRDKVGYIRGLRDALVVCQDIEKENT